MTKALYALIFLFFEIILETGIDLASSLGRGLSFKNLFLYGLLMLLLKDKFTKKKLLRDAYVKKITNTYLIFLFFGFLSFFFAILFPMQGYERSDGVFRIKGELLDPVVCFFLFLHFSKTLIATEKTLKVLILILGLASAFTLVDTLAGGIIFGLDNDSQRPNGAFGEPNQTAALLALCLPLMLSRAFMRRGNKIIYGSMVIITLAALGLTGSRGGMLGAIIGLLSFLVYTRKQLSLGNKMFFIISGPMMVFAAWLVMPDYYQQLLIERFSFIGSEDIDYYEVSAGRTMLWTYAFSLWLERPIFGIGWAGYSMVAGVATHSVYLERLADVGIIGFVLFTVLQFRIWRCMHSTRKFIKGDNKLYLGAMTSSFIGLNTALLFVNLYIPTIIVTAVIALMISYCNHIRLNFRSELIKQKMNNL